MDAHAAPFFRLADHKPARSQGFFVIVYGQGVVLSRETDVKWERRKDRCKGGIYRRRRRVMGRKTVTLEITERGYKLKEMQAEGDLQWDAKNTAS
uniref:Transposase n=1 Tax=Steinernema glaseri TaxID=37863 RepID=A0A1I7Y739_9BILA